MDDVESTLEAFEEERVDAVLLPRSENVTMAIVEAGGRRYLLSASGVTEIDWVPNREAWVEASCAWRVIGLDGGSILAAAAATRDGICGSFVVALPERGRPSTYTNVVRVEEAARASAVGYAPTLFSAAQALPEVSGVKIDSLELPVTIDPTPPVVFLTPRGLVDLTRAVVEEAMNSLTPIVDLPSVGADDDIRARLGDGEVIPRVRLGAVEGYLVKAGAAPSAHELMLVLPMLLWASVYSGSVGEFCLAGELPTGVKYAIALSAPARVAVVAAAKTWSGLAEAVSEDRPTGAKSASARSRMAWLLPERKIIPWIDIWLERVVRVPWPEDLSEGVIETILTLDAASGSGGEPRLEGRRI